MDNDVYKQVINRITNVYCKAFVLDPFGGDTTLPKFIEMIEKEVKGEKENLGGTLSDLEYCLWLRKELKYCISNICSHPKPIFNAKFIKENKPLVEEICSLLSSLQTYIDRTAEPFLKRR